MVGKGVSGLTAGSVWLIVRGEGGGGGIDQGYKNLQILDL